MSIKHVHVSLFVTRLRKFKMRIFVKLEGWFLPIALLHYADFFDNFLEICVNWNLFYGEYLPAFFMHCFVNRPIGPSNVNKTFKHFRLGKWIPKAKECRHFREVLKTYFCLTHTQNICLNGRRAYPSPSLSKTSNTSSGGLVRLSSLSLRSSLLWLKIIKTMR